MIIFEKVLYIRGIEPFMELSWTKMFKYITARWQEMVLSN